ncbi:M16 family metallopeptidase [Geopsychrobacter electrodiphilus]|uniref:M16 family metallopeptidase n=1 Tax=Geopsychrobacter electrodiphilus TaxID=225196 RepID=UPI00035F653F|nr:pitrilysin family protein [Geopsychrobacter electrodiphilus]
MKTTLVTILATLLTALLLPPASFAQPNQEILRETLANGLRVMIIHNDLAPVVTTQINYLVGSNEAPQGYPGMAHAQEHMMFRGSPGLSADQLASLIASMGGEFNANTQQTVTQYFFTVPAGDLGVALHLESLRMRDVLDSDSLWDKERGAIEQEVAQDLSNPEYLFYTQLLGKLYSGTPYAHDALGSRSSFDKTSGAMLHKFHRDWYGPNNAILVIVGKIDPHKTLAMVKELFGAIPARPLPLRTQVKLQPLKPAAIRLETDRPYGMAVVAYRLPGYNSPDFAAGQVLADVLDSRRGNLYALVPAGQALYAGFSAEPLPDACTAYAMAAFARGADGEALLDKMQGIIGDYLKNGLPADLIEAAKRKELAAAEFEKNSIPGLADSWSQALAIEGRQSPSDDLEAIRRVTAADVARVARSVLRNETSLTAVLTPRPSDQPVAARGYGGGESFTPSRTLKVKLPAWAKDAGLSSATLPAQLKVTESLLPNGLRLIVLPSDISHTVSLYGEVRNNPDLQAPKGQEGVAGLLDELFAYGSTHLDRMSYQKALDDISAEASAGTAFSLQTLSEHFEQGVALLADNLLHPALPEKAFQVVRDQSARSRAGELQSPGYLSHRALHEGLYPADDPALRQATPATIKALNLAAVKAYYRQVFRPDMTTIVIVGDIDPTKAGEIIGKAFGSWGAKGPKPVIDLPAVPDNKPSVHRVVDRSRVQDQVTLAQTLGLTRTDADHYALEVGAHVLAGAFYATRLYHDLREEAGLVYSVDAMFHFGKTRSNFGIFYACDPQNVDKARALVVRDLKQMQTTPVSDNELRQAKTLLLSQLILSRAGLDQIGGDLLSLATEGLPLNEPLRAARQYRKTTAAQVKQAFAHWLRPEALVQVVLGAPDK